MLLDFSSECPDFVGPFLSQSVQTFALLAENGDLVFAFGVQSFVVPFEFLDLFLVLLSECEHCLVFVGESSDLSRRQS